MSTATSTFRVDNPFKGTVLVFTVIKTSKHNINHEIIPQTILMLPSYTDQTKPGDIVIIGDKKYTVHSTTNPQNKVVYIKLLPPSES